MNRKILGIAFILGVLLCGLGGGVSFAQYSKLEYAGERSIGEEKLVTETVEAVIEEDVKIYVDAYAPLENISLETDDSIPVNKILFDVTYNSERVSMVIKKSPYESEDISYVEVVNEYGDVIEYREYDDNNNDSDKGEVFHVGRYGRYDDLKDFFEVKDMFLADLKNGKVGSYSVVFIQNITVRVNPANADRVDIYY